MPSIWDLIPASAWPVQPFIRPPNPLQLSGRLEDTAARGDASMPTSPAFGWAPASDDPPGSRTYPGATSDADVADPAYTARLADDARRAYEFVMWAFGPPSRGPAQRTRELTADPGPSADTPAIPIAATAVAPPPQRAGTQAWPDEPPPTSPTIDLRGDRDEYGLLTSGPRSPWWNAAGQHAYFRAARGQEMQGPFWFQPPPAPPGAAGSAPASPLANFQAGIDAWKAEHGMTPTWQPPAPSQYYNAARGIDVAPSSDANWQAAQAHAQQMANRAVGLNGVERYHFFPERWFIDPFRDTAELMQAGVPVIDPQTGRPDQRYVEHAWDIATALAAGAPKAENAAGIFGGRLSKTADHQALAKAQEMASKGADPRDIWQQTGWFLHPVDRLWKNEINDVKAAMIPLKPGQLTTTLIEQQINHPELFAAHPELRDIRVTALPQDQ